MKKKKEDKELYFIALVPDEPVYSEIWQLKEEVRDRYDSKAALRSPPHITLQMPFKWKAVKEKILYNTLASIAEGFIPFDLTLNNFGAFEPRVIYVHVEDSEQLISLQQEVIKQAASQWHIYQMSGSRPFRPHMTIAFRDLKKPKFYEAWQEFESRQYQAKMSVSQLTLLKHNGRTWDIHKNFPIGGIKI